MSTSRACWRAVTPRLATVVDADLIVVMDGGVVQKGTHTELLNQTHSLYRRLCLQQFGEASLAEIERRSNKLTVRLRNSWKPSCRNSVHRPSFRSEQRGSYRS